MPAPAASDRQKAKADAAKADAAKNQFIVLAECGPNQACPACLPTRLRFLQKFGVTYSYLAVGKHKNKPVSCKPPCRSQRARVALTEERQRTGELLLENRRLAAEAATAGQDSWDVVSFLRGELLGREAEVARLVAALSQVHSLQSKHSSDSRGLVLNHCRLPAEADVTGQRTANMRCPHAR